MSLLNKKLSALQPGSCVRFINLSGQVIEGIVTENDKEESLSVQITLSRYLFRQKKMSPPLSQLL